MSHMLATAAYLPFLALQSSVSIWTVPLVNEDGIDVNLGSFMMCGVYLIAALFALIAPYVVKRIGSNLTIVICYGTTDE